MRKYRLSKAALYRYHAVLRRLTEEYIEDIEEIMDSYNDGEIDEYQMLDYMNVTNETFRDDIRDFQKKYFKPQLTIIAE